jgi:hypothetical protein
MSNAFIRLCKTLLVMATQRSPRSFVSQPSRSWTIVPICQLGGYTVLSHITLQFHDDARQHRFQLTCSEETSLSSRFRDYCGMS